MLKKALKISCIKKGCKSFMLSNYAMNTFLGKSLLLIMFNVGLLTTISVMAEADKQESTDIIASIKPIQLLVDEIRGGTEMGEPLLHANQNHHLRTLKPSQQRRINAAKHVFYISDEFEGYFRSIKRADSSPAAAFKYIELGKINGIRLLSTRSNGALSHVYVKELKNNDSSAEVHNGHHHVSEIDWHLWLNPDNAILMLQKIRDVLIETRPSMQQQYTTNYENAVIKITRQSQRIAEKMMDVMKVPFITLHDGYQYFEEQYGLNSKGAILRHDDDMTGVKRIQLMRRLIKDNGIRCVFKEAQYADKAIKPVIEGFDVSIMELDSLGQSLSSDVRSYTQLMENFAGSFYRSLSQDR
ncbi:MAG: metal ABC transporter solute-binding protein, Zn/Mn family [Arenicella sp.]